ncbi:hypothetical protein AYX08_06165 [Stenotrophomonas maltophilia]|nr:hypothetical protein AYX08_06165 [Stenotrophomonas maltophilia]
MLFQHPLNNETGLDREVDAIFAGQAVEIEQHLIALIAAEVMGVVRYQLRIVALRDSPAVFITKFGTLDCRHSIELLKIRFGSGGT